MDPIKYKDFHPAETDSSFWKGATYERTDKLLAKANEWLRNNPPQKLINIETVMLYNNPGQSRKDDITHMNLSIDSLYVVPTIRVWYQ